MNFRKFCRWLLPLLILIGLQADQVSAYVLPDVLLSHTLLSAHGAVPDLEEPEEAALVRRGQSVQQQISEPDIAWQAYPAIDYSSFSACYSTYPVVVNPKQEVCYGLLFLRYLF